MDKRKLGLSTLEITPLMLGGNVLGWTADEAASFAVLDAFVANGGNSLDTADVSYKSSTISAIDTWKSPVLIWQGDDDRNVEFSQTIGLVDLLRAHKVEYELIVVPDDTHETLIHKRWLYLYGRMEDFLRRKIWEKTPHEASR